MVLFHKKKNLEYICTKTVSCLFPVFLILNGIHSTARLCIEHEIKSCIFTEATSIAQEGVLLIIINRSKNRKYKLVLNIHLFIYVKGYLCRISPYLHL